MSEDEFWNQLAIQPLALGGEKFWSPAQALEVLHECDAKELAVIGLEGFFVERGQVQSILEAIADFSGTAGPDWRAFSRQCNEAAEHLLQKWGSHFHTETGSFMVAMTAMDEQAWQQLRS